MKPKENMFFCFDNKEVTSLLTKLPTTSLVNEKMSFIEISKKHCHIAKQRTNS